MRSVLLVLLAVLALGLIFAGVARAADAAGTDPVAAGGAGAGIAAALILVAQRVLPRLIAGSQATADAHAAREKAREEREAKRDAWLQGVVDGFSAKLEKVTADFIAANERQGRGFAEALASERRELLAFFSPRSAAPTSPPASAGAAAAPVSEVARAA